MIVPKMMCSFYERRGQKQEKTSWECNTVDEGCGDEASGYSDSSINETEGVGSNDKESLHLWTTPQGT